MKSFIRTILPAACLLIASAGASEAATIHHLDFIPDASRTNFNGFEALSTIVYYGASYTEDGITVEQVNGDADGIWTAYGWGAEGLRSWYPNGGDYGYTKITRLDGSDFFNIGLIYSDGGGGVSNYLHYELLNNGAITLSGTFYYGSLPPHYIGFSGGGFDELHLKSTFDNSGWTGFGALAIDSIELSNGQQAPVPEPSTLLLLGAGIAGLGLYRRRAYLKK